MPARLAATEQANGIERGQDEHVDQRHLLQPDRVGKRQHRVQRQRQPGAARDAQPGADQEQPRDHGEPGRHRQRSAGERAFPLARMRTIGGKVREVIDHVDRRCGGTERRHDRERVAPRGEVAEISRGQQRHQREQVLHPLIWPQRTQCGTRARHPVLDFRDHVVASRRGTPYRAGRVHHHGRGRVLPDGMIGGVVAGVDEAALAEPPAQFLRLAAAAQIADAVRGDHLVEHAEMRGHRLGHLAIGGGAQHDRAPAGAFLLDQSQQLAAVTAVAPRRTANAPPVPASVARDHRRARPAAGTARANPPGPP